MRGTSAGVGLGLSGTSWPKEYGGCALVLPSFRACSFPVFLNLHTDAQKQITQMLSSCCDKPKKKKHQQLAALVGWHSWVSAPRTDN